MSSNNPEHGNGSSSRKPSSKLFFSLKSYNRFLLSRSRRSQRSSSVDSIPYSLCETSSSVDSIPYSCGEINTALENSQHPHSPPLPFVICAENLTIPCCSFKRCALRNEEVVIFCCHTGFEEPDLSPSHLSTLTSRSHHPSLVKLLGASKSQDPAHIYMVYEDTPGATLYECLRNPSNSNPLSSWIWRMQVALDLAQGLEYIHHHCGMVHNMIKSSTVTLTEPNSNACIVLFGAAEFEHELIQRTIGYMAPEILSKDGISQKSDVYAFGVVILELISGKAARDELLREVGCVYLVETARDTVEPDDEIIRRGRVIRFVDPLLHGSFPMETADSLIQVAVKCVDEKPKLRPEMASVVEDIRRLFVDSKVWQEETMNSPTTAFSLSSMPCRSH